MLVYLSKVCFGSPVTELQYVGYSFALFFMFLHKQHKRDEFLFHKLYNYCGISNSNSNSNSNRSYHDNVNNSSVAKL